jgi:hypothetical protein
MAGACWFLAELIPSTLKMEAICSSETSADTKRTTRRHIPEDDTLNNHRCETLKSYESISDCREQSRIILLLIYKLSASSSTHRQW